MVSEMYKRREKLGWILLVIVLIIALGWGLLQPPRTTAQWLEILNFLFPIGVALIIISVSRSQYNKVKDFQIPNSELPLLHLNHVVLKKDAALTPQLLLFEKNGKFIGRVKPLKIPWWMYPIILWNHSFIEFFSLSYVFVTHDGTSPFTFHKKGGLKRTKLSIFNQEDLRTGTYVQKEFKDLFHIQGRLFNEKEEPILSIKASGFSGDFRWLDEQGYQWAYFYNGKFPHEYTNIFRDMQNDIVELSDRLSQEDKIRMFAVIGYLFMFRIKQ